MKIDEANYRLEKELVEAYKGIAPATLGHMKDLRIMDSGIKPVYRDCKLVGPAFTVRIPGGVDAAILNKVAESAKPGDVIVVDRCGDTEHAVLGEVRALKDIRRGIAGWVVDGAICDVIAIGDMGFPTFSRTVSALVAKPVGLQGEINVPVTCGGVVVNPGDLIIGDDDGVVVLSAEEAKNLLPKCQEVEEREIELRKQYTDILYRNKK